MNAHKIFPFRILPIFALFALLLFGGALYGQDAEEVQTISIKSRGLQRVGNVFESVWLIDNQTVLVPLRKTFEFDIQHRFGTIEDGYENFWGLYAPSNIRLGFSYVPVKNLMLGIGFTKDRLLWDLSAKYALLKQDRFGFDVAYFVNVAADTRKKEKIQLYTNATDRYSFFHQLMVARKVSRDFSVQASISLSHFNKVEAYVNDAGELDKKMNNDHLAFSLMGRYKISDAFAFIANYDQPITKHTANNPYPNISFGVELATPLHAFQVFAGNYKELVPQYNNMFNQNDFNRIGSYLIGFNITRLLDTQEESLGDMMFKRKSKKAE